MKLSVFINLFFVAALVQFANSTLMLGSMMLAAKTGLMLGKMGVGGMMLMLLAASQNDSGGTSYGSKKRSIRSAESEVKDSMNNTKDGILTERMVRQVDATFDTLTCIPKFVCGMNAQPPTKKTTLMNDYSHLLKLFFSQDRDDEDYENDEETPVSPKDRQEMAVALSEEDNLEDMVNEELIDDDPSLLPFVLKDVIKHGESGPHPPPGYYPPRKPQKKFSPFSLSSYLPKLEAGLGTKPKDSDFDGDPFFQGFRNLKDVFENTSSEGEPVLPFQILSLENDKTENKMSKQQKANYIKRKSREVEMADDPVKRYRIAAEVGQKLKNRKDCTKVFKKCPYKWEEVTGMVSAMRDTITKHPIITGKLPTNDKIVYLKTTSGSNENQTGLSISTAGQGDQGPTTVVHDLGNGNLMEISMKLVPMVDLPVPVKVEDLGPIPIKVSINTTKIKIPEIPFPLRDTPTLSEADVDALALSYQQTNSNGSWTQTKKPLNLNPQLKGNLPYLKDEEATMPSTIVDDDEFDDAHPIIIRTKPQPPPRRRKVPKTTTTPKPPLSPPKKKKQPNDEVELEDEDGDDDDEDDDEYDISDQDRKDHVTFQRRTANLQMRPRLPLFNSQMRPFRITAIRSSDGFANSEAD